MNKWSIETKIKFWGLVVAVFVGILGLLGFLFNIFGQPKVTLGVPQFQYVFEGAYDQKKPEYEVAFPLGWDDTQKSNAKILVRADYNGSKYAGITYIKIRKADGSDITVGKWDDFNTDAGKQQIIPLNFSQLFEFSGNTRDIANLVISSADPLAPIRKQFKIYVENSGQIISGSEMTVTILNTPWFHRTYFDYYEVNPGDKLKAYVEVINFGAEADFSIATSAFRISTLSYQLDPKLVRLVDSDGWWPDRKGSFQRIGDSDTQTAIHLKQGQQQTVAIDLPANALSEQGVYTYIVQLFKKLPILDYGTLDWQSNWYSRDARQYSTYVVVGR